MKNRITLGLLFIGFTFSYAQVGINTTTPNDATVLDINSNAKGILIPRLTETERNTSLADNDPATVPPMGVVNTALAKGTLIYNTTEDRFEFWDGALWRQLFVATSSQAGNDGVVRINSGAGGVKPSLVLTKGGNGFGPEEQVTYVTPLMFADAPTTSWPETTPDYNVPTTDKTQYIYNSATQKFRENAVNGQVHIWRLIASVTSGASSSGSVMAVLRNPNTGFQVNAIALLPSGSATPSGNLLTFYFYTIADPESLAVGRGYELFLSANMNVTAEIQSLTRVSLFKD